jgi:glycosyltransferase involved in cell wall biosynthesis
MILKLFRAVWFLSVLVVLANLLYVYASLPVQVVVSNEGEGTTLGREWFFYISMFLVVGINVLVYLFKLFYAQDEGLRAWFHGLVITFNIFIVISLHALSVYNSKEMFDHSLVSPYLLGSLALILLWAISWPAYLFVQRFLVKQAV